MRISEIILEDDSMFDNGIEDEAHSRGDEALMTTLELLRNEAENSNAVTPRVAVDTVIQRVQMIPGNEAFNYTLLDNAIADNEAIKAMVRGKPEDDPKTGKKYLYLTPAESSMEEPTVDDGNGNQVPADVADTTRTVGGMAKRALAKRS
jgi:hypothetical protein